MSMPNGPIELDGPEDRNASTDLPSHAGADPAAQDEEPSLLSEDERAVTGTVGSVLFVGIIWMVLLVMLRDTADFRPSARIVPRIAAVPSLIVATVLLAREVAAIVGRLRSRGTSPAPASARDELLSFLWLTGYAAGVFAVGFTIASAVYMVVFLRSYGQQSWRRVLLTTVGVVGIIVGVFDGLLGIRVFEGLLFQ